MFKKECPLSIKSVKDGGASFCECWRNGNCVIHPKRYCFFIKPKESEKK